MYTYQDDGTTWAALYDKQTPAQVAAELYTNHPKADRARVYALVHAAVILVAACDREMEWEIDEITKEITRIIVAQKG